MSSGHVYVFSNPSLKTDVLKIGLTTLDPEIRARALSRSTAIPEPFHCEFALPMKDCALAERRLHLLLKSRRVNENKEFFCLSVSEAISLCKSIKDFEDEEAPPAETLLARHDFLFKQIRPRQSLSVLKALMHILSATQHNTLIDHLIEERLLIVDGFTSAKAWANELGIRNRAAAVTLKKIAEVAGELRCPLSSGEESLPIFSTFVYDKGHVAWTFHPKFRRLFAVPGDHDR